MTRPVPLRRMVPFGLMLGLTAATATACPPPPPGPCTPTALTEGHVDAPGIAFEDGELHLHLHDHDADVEYEPECAVIVASDAAEATVPSDPAFSFLGAAGSPIWVLPQVEDPALPHVGYAAEEVPSGQFEDDVLDLSVTAVDGPGAFIVYSVDGFGVPTVLFDSGATLPQSIEVPAGAHTHVNWAVTEPGDYTVTYEAGGQLAGGPAVSSGSAEFSYEFGA